MHGLVKVDVTDSIAWLTLNRPEAMNALNRPLVAALDSALSQVATDPTVRVVVLTGCGKAFCAGGDLKEFLDTDGAVDQDELLSFVRYASGVLDRLPQLGKPVIASVNGFAMAGGLELLLACDLVVAAESARLGDAHSNYGVLPGGGGAVRLARVVGPTVAKYLAFTGEAIPAERLVPFGLVNEVVPDEALHARTRQLASRIANKSAPGLAHMKRLINDGLEQPLDTALRLEHQALAVHVHSSDMREGLAAFRERREPKFTSA